MGKRPRSLGPHDDECATAKAARELVCLDGPDPTRPMLVSHALSRFVRKRAAAVVATGGGPSDPAAKRRRAHDAAERYCYDFGSLDPRSSASAPSAELRPFLP